MRCAIFISICEFIGTIGFVSKLIRLNKNSNCGFVLHFNRFISVSKKRIIKSVTSLIRMAIKVMRVVNNHYWAFIERILPQKINSEYFEFAFYYARFKHSLDKHWQMSDQIALYWIIYRTIEVWRLITVFVVMETNQQSHKILSCLLHHSSIECTIWHMNYR